ncbi:hypothetical protein ACFYKX_10245 [Cytobacillus sp. FJAT-54145]|uniref:YgiT-type zinc finger protein n=1 Tax=Cytobacillus spartinae TaxID=3299023 RepID=A0ABW6KE64_9BACI
MTCSCQTKNRQIINTTVTREGIEIFLMGTPADICECGKITFPSEVEELIDTYVKIKKEQFPDTEPVLTLHVPELL